MSDQASHRPEPIIPPHAAPLRTLVMAMAVMCYLAVLAAGGLVLINRSVEAWTGDLAREITVQIREIPGRNMEEDLAKAAAIIKTAPGVMKVTVLDEQAAIDLLEPWIGGIDGLEDLPVPRLIAVEIDPDHPPDFAALETALRNEVPGVSLDTHKRWQAELTRMARVLTTLAYAILVLIGICAVAMVIFATRAALEANREVVEVLHLVGARDGFIARQVWGRFLKTGLTAGIIGLVLGILTFFLAAGAAPESFAAISREFLSPARTHLVQNYLVLAAVPLVATLICLITSRVTLMRILKSLR
ncbi:MAG: cell division protein FtsX [Parvibaculaceae bacterium]